MTSVDWLAFVLASGAVVLAPGPGSLFVARSAATAGGAAGVRAMLGIMVGDACLIVISLLGVSALFHAYPALFQLIRLAGAGYLVYLGIQALLAGSGRQSDAPADPGLPFRRAVAITLLNPKAVFFFMAFFPVFITSAEGGLVLPYSMMTLVFMGISATYLGFLTLVSARLAATFRESRRLQALARRFCGGLLIAFGLRVAATSG